MVRPVHFEIPADEPERAVRFYESVFGWKINKWAGPVQYWLAETGPKDEPGIDGAILPRSEMASGTVNTLGVPSLDEYADRVRSNGGQVLMDKTPIPGVGYFCYCKDTEGNQFGLMEPDESVTAPSE